MSPLEAGSSLADIEYPSTILVVELLEIVNPVSATPPLTLSKVIPETSN
jgi:hypothetical protein